MRHEAEEEDENGEGRRGYPRCIRRGET